MNDFVLDLGSPPKWLKTQTDGRLCTPPCPSIHQDGQKSSHSSPMDEWIPCIVELQFFSVSVFIVQVITVYDNSIGRGENHRGIQDIKSDSDCKVHVQYITSCTIILIHSCCNITRTFTLYSNHSAHTMLR